jgi:alpha-galactosidase
LKRENGRVKDIHVAYIGGGSRGWAWGFMMDLADDDEMEGSVSLYDIDKAAAENNRIIGEKISAHRDAKSRWRYSVADSLEEALTGADVVVISILPGTFKEMRSDVHLPETAGIYQPVGDTIGAGGFVRAMRTVPMFVEIALAIRNYAPEAWVINYTNPMSVCVAALYEAFPKIRAFGCCHEVFGTQKLLAAMIEDSLGIKNISRQEIRVNVTGINHFTWFDSASYQDMDLFPVYRDFAEKYAETGFEGGGDTNWINNNFHCLHRVKFDLFRRFGLIAAAGDRHLAEFVPGWYLKSPETVSNWKFRLTTVDWRERDLAERLARSKALVSGEEEVEITPSGEEGHLLIKALMGLGDLISNVNLPNMGQISNLPLGAVVETNALFQRSEIRPIQAGTLPGNVAALVSRHVLNQRNTLEAALTCDLNLALTTFLNDPMCANLTPLSGEALLRQMLKNTQEYLPSGWLL